FLDVLAVPVERAVVQVIAANQMARLLQEANRFITITRGSTARQQVLQLADVAPRHEGRIQPVSVVVEGDDMRCLASPTRGFQRAPQADERAMEGEVGALDLDI